MEIHGISRQEYMRQLLDAYRTTPGTTGRVHRVDRLLAERLYEDGVPLAAVKNALVLAAARRLLRPENAPSLGTVQSLHYFRAVIDEILNSNISEDYFCYLREKVARFKKETK